MPPRQTASPKVIRPSQPLTQPTPVATAAVAAPPEQVPAPVTDGDELGAGIKIALPTQVTSPFQTGVEDAPTTDGSEDGGPNAPVITETTEAPMASAIPEPEPEPAPVKAPEAESDLSGISEKTRAEMEAGRAHIKQHNNVTVRRTAKGVVELSDRTLREMQAGTKRLEHHAEFEERRKILGD